MIREKLISMKHSFFKVIAMSGTKKQSIERSRSMDRHMPFGIRDDVSSNLISSFYVT